jgi:hypothetical protein
MIPRLTRSGHEPGATQPHIPAPDSMLQRRRNRATVLRTRLCPGYQPKPTVITTKWFADAGVSLEEEYF